MSSSQEAFHQGKDPGNQVITGREKGLFSPQKAQDKGMPLHVEEFPVYHARRDHKERENMPTIDEAIRLIQRRITALREVLTENKDRIDGKGSQALKRSLDAAQHTLNGLQKERDRRIDHDIHAGLKKPLKVNWPLKFKKRPNGKV